MGELRIMCALRHPCVIDVHGAFEEGDHLHLIMALAPNGDVRQMLVRYEEEQKDFDDEYWELVTRLAEQTVAGIRYLLGKGILHHDLKAQNLLLDENYKVKVSDFGLAKATDEVRFGASSASEGVQKGSSLWMSPEYLNGSPYDEKCDVYSFGMVLLELVTRRLPWEEVKELSQIVLKVAQGQRPPLPDNGLPSQLRDLIQRCWAHDAGERPTFDEIAQALAASRFGSAAGRARGGVGGAGAACAIGADVAAEDPLLLEATLLRLVGGAWHERRAELTQGGVLSIFNRERREAQIVLPPCGAIDVLGAPSPAQLLEAADGAAAAAAPSDAPRKPTLSRKMTAGGRSRRSSSTSSFAAPLAFGSARAAGEEGEEGAAAAAAAMPPLPPTHRFAFALRGATGGDVALAVVSAEEQEAWTAALGSMARRALEAFAARGSGACKWLAITDELEVEARPSAQRLLLLLHARAGGAPLHLIAIIGAARQGKSTFMNLLACMEGLFDISHESEPCTSGIDLSACTMTLQRFAASGGDGDGGDGAAVTAAAAATDVRVGFVDAEGQGDQDLDYDTMLVTPALLMAQVVAFNWRGAPQ